jgi:predicted nucleic acid-binding protein
MRPVLFDSSVYIRGMRRADDEFVAVRRLPDDTLVWLSAVVLEELYAGATGRSLPLVKQIERDFGSVDQILVPNLDDWIETGRVLGRLAAKYDYEAIGRGRLTNDALIAMSAARAGVCVITTNERDFRRLAEFRKFQWELATP